MDHQPLSPFLTLGFILVAGYFAGKLANYCRLPQISGYIIVGLVLSPSITGILAKEDVDAIFGFTSEMALSIIAYSIGGSLKMSQVRELGKEIFWITFAQGLGAFICTILAFYTASHFLALPESVDETLFICMALIFGGISVATAPAATMAIVHELRAKGPLTTTLLGVVALDDALSVIIFSGVVTIVMHLSGTNIADNSVIFDGLMEIGGALLTGLLAGLIFSHFFASWKRPELTLMLSMGAIFLVTGLSHHFAFSSLLANMTMGFVVTNRVAHADDLFHQLDLIEETIFCLFFTLAAAHFDSKVFTASASLGVIILTGRFIGKLSGTYLGGKASKAPVQVTRFLGITLLPQAGLSLGLIFLAEPIVPPEIFELLLSAMLASIILNEIISPPLVKWVLCKSGECNPDR